MHAKSSVWDDMRPVLCHVAAFSFVINLLFLVPAIFMLQVFDRVLPSASSETLVVLLAGCGVTLALLLVLDYVRHRLQHALGALLDERLSPRVTEAIVAKVARAPHLASAEGIRDVAALRNAFSTSALVALFDAPWVIVYVLAIWAFHPAMGLAAAGAAVLMLLLAWLNDRSSRRALDGLQREGRRASRYLESSLRNAEVLQALGMTAALLERWRALQAQVSALQTRASRGNVAFTAVTRTLRQAIQILMLALGAYLVIVEHSSAGIMMAATILLGRAVQPVEQLVGSWRVLTDARAAYRRLRELIGQPEARPSNLTMPRPEGRLTVEAVSFRAPGTDKMVLLGITFALAAGEGLAIIGPSAAGKSSLARLITGVWAPAGGTVRLDGADVATWPREDLGAWIGYIPQDVELFDGTVAENIARLGSVDSEAVIAAGRRANAHDMILSLAQGYDTPLGEQGIRLSPGQRQRIALARALYGDPQLVVLDEPNANLDYAGEAALAESLRNLRKDGVTFVIVTHRPSLVTHVDKILWLEGGRVHRFGPAAEVLKATPQRVPA